MALMRAHVGWSREGAVNDDLPPLVDCPPALVNNHFNYQHEQNFYGDQQQYEGPAEFGHGGQFLTGDRDARGQAISTMGEENRLQESGDYVMPDDGDTYHPYCEGPGQFYDFSHMSPTTSYEGGQDQSAPWNVSPSWGSYAPDWQTQSRRPSTGGSVFSQTQHGMDEAEDMPPPVDAYGNHSPWSSPTMPTAQANTTGKPPFVFGEQKEAQSAYSRPSTAPTSGGHESVFAYDHEEGSTFLPMTLYNPKDASTSLGIPPAESTLYEPPRAPGMMIMYDPSEESQEGSGYVPSTRRPHRRRDASYIPRPPNAFILFRSSFIKTQQVSGKIEGSHSTLSKIIGKYWKTLPQEEREKWEAKAVVAQDEHRKRYPDWRFRPGANALVKAKVKDGTDPGGRRRRSSSTTQDPAASAKRDAINAARRESAALKRKAAADALKNQNGSEVSSPARSEVNKEDRERSRERRTTKIADLLAEGKRGEELEKAILRWDGEDGGVRRAVETSIVVEKPQTKIKTEVVHPDAIPKEKAVIPDIFVAYVPPKTPESTDPHFNSLGPLLSATVPTTPRRKTPGRPRKESSARVLSTDPRYKAPISPSKRKAQAKADSPQRRSRPTGVRTTAPPSEDEEGKFGLSLTAMFRRSTSAPATNARVPYKSFSAFKEPVVSPDVAMVPPSQFIHQRRDSLPVARRDRLPPLLFGAPKTPEPLPENHIEVADTNWRDQESFSPNWNDKLSADTRMQEQESYIGYAYSPGPFGLDSCSIADGEDDCFSIDHHSLQKPVWPQSITTPLNLPYHFNMPRMQFGTPLQSTYTPNSTYSSLTGWAGGSPPSSDPSPLSLISALTAEESAPSSSMRTNMTTSARRSTAPDASLQYYTAGLQAFGLQGSA